MEPLNQNLGEFFNTANSGSAPGRADPAAPSAPSGLPGFFTEKPPILKSSSVIPTSTVDAVASTEGLTPQQRTVMGALLGQESNNGANAVTSVNGARGAGQILPATFRRYAKPGESIDNPDSNLAVMARIVKDLGTKFADDPARIATGYFSGDGNVNAAGATPWVTDHADGYGKRVSSYVAEVLKRVEGIGTPAAPAAEAPAAPDLSKAPKWADVVAKPAFQGLSDTDKAQAKQAYFDHWVAPHIDRSQRNALRDQFLAKKDEAPGMLSRAASAVSNAINKVSGEGVGGNVDPMMGIDPSGQDSATGPAQTPTDPALGVMQNAPDRPASTIAVAPLFRQHFENAYNAATPEQRKALESLPGVMGDLAKERNTQFAAAPATSPIDPRAEARAQRLAENGMDPALTASWAKTAAARGVAPGDEVGSVSKTDFDFDTQKKFNEDPFYANPVVRAAVKGVEGYKQGVLGINQFVAEAIGADQVAQGQANMAKDSRKFTAAIGEGKTYGGRMFEGAVSSIAQQLPALLGGAVTGSEAVVLSSMFAQSFGQEYGEGRSRGQTSGEATMRAAQFAALEVIGEKFGLKESLAGIKAAAKGNIDEAVRQMVKAGIKEVPGEELTTVGQFGVDKQGGGIGLNTEAGLKDLVQQMADTFVQTVMQTGMMAGGAKTGGAAVNVVNSPERQIANEINRAADAFGNTQVTARPGPDIKTGNEIDPAATRMPAEAPAATPVPEAPTHAPADQGEQDFLRAAAQVIKEEKQSNPDDWTADERAAYGSGDWRKFSRLRGYTEAEIENYGEFMRLAYALDAKHGDGYAQSLMAELPDQQGDYVTQQKQPAASKAATPAAQPDSAVANQDVLDYAEMRHAALLTKRDGQTVEHIGEDGKPAQVDQPGAGLTADEQAELTALEANGGNPQALAKLYGLDIGSSIDAAAHEAAPSPKNDLPEPTPAQKEAGNYKKGHVLLQGLDISIENPQGSTRSGTDPNGKAWSIDLAHHYGYIKRTEGADGDQVDVFVGPNPDSGKVFVVDQISPSSGKFDEHKVMLGFDSKEAADAGYHANYEQGWTGRGALTEMSMDQFKTWLKTGNTKKPLAKPKTEKEAQALRSIDRDPKNGYARVKVGGKPHFVTPYDDHFVIRESTGSIAKSDEGVQLRFKSEADAIAYANSNSKRAQPKPVAEAAPLAKPKTEKEAKARRQENAANVPQPAQVPQKTDAAPAAQSTPPVAEKVKPKTEKEAKRLNLRGIAERLGVSVTEVAGGYRAGGGSIHIPAEDTQIEGAVSADHVFAHEIGHAVMQKRQVSFARFPKAEVLKHIANYDDLIAASKAFRPGVHQHENERYRRHANKPDEIIADAIGAVLIGEKPVSLLQPMMDNLGWTERDLGLASNSAQSTPPVAEKVKPKTEKEAIAQREAKAADLIGSPELRSLLNRAIKEKDLKIGNARAQLFQEGVIDAMKGVEPQKARTSYIEGHTWAMAALGKPVVNAKQDALFAEPPKTEKQAKAKRKAKKTEDSNLAVNAPKSDYNDPYEHLETRPGTTDEQRNAGRDAVDALSKRIAGYRANGLQVSVLGNRLLKNFIAGKPNQLVGQVAKTPADLASLAQVYRDPRFETFRAIYLAGDAIVGEAGYSSRLPASVALPSDLHLRMAKDMQRFNADGYYIMHNHPSGSATPSDADARVTVLLAKHVPGFRSHVVIDHNQYAVINQNGESEVVKDATLNGTDFSGAPELEHELLGVKLNSPEAAVRLAKALQVPEGHATLILTQRESRVQLIVDVPMGLLKDVSDQSIAKGKAVIRRMARDTGSGGRRFLILPERAGTRAFEKWIEQGVFTDVVSASGESLREIGFYHEHDFLDANQKPMRVSEANKGHDSLNNGKTESPAFKKWFGDSKVVGKDGKPLVVYHGTNKTEDGEAFKIMDAYSSNYGLFGQGSYFTEDPGIASSYTEKGKGTSPSVYPVYVAIRNPIDMDVQANRAQWEHGYPDVDFDAYHEGGDMNESFYRAAEEHFREEGYERWEGAEAMQDGLRRMGYDGITHIGGARIKSDSTKHRVWIAFDPEQVKSATGNNGEYRPDSPNILNESQDAYNIPAAIKASQKDLVKEFGKPRFKNVDRWDRSVGTQLNKAMKEPHYAKVFNIAVDRENTISLTSIRPSELAPAFLPRVDDFMSAAKTLVLGRKKNKQMLLATDALVSGTLAGGKVLEGKVWSETELRKDFGMDDVGIAHYRQARAAIDASLDEVAAAEGYAALQMLIPRSTRDVVIRDPAKAETILTAAIDKRIAMEKLILKKAKTNGAPKTKLDGIETEVSLQTDARTTLLDVFTKAKALKEAGYTPLMRFGKFKVTVEEVEPGTGKMRLDENGQPNTLYFGRFETEGEAQAEYYRQSVLYRDRADISVKAGPTNDEQYRMYSGLSPETLALFAEEVGSDTVMKTLYQVAVSERSSLKRRLERKNIAGFSQDMPRILANFITSNGRFAAQRYYTRDLNNAIKYIPRDKADVQKEAQRLKDFLDNPKDGGASASSVAFVWFLGGNIASAAVNATQPFMMTAPYLTQWGSAQAGVSMVKALPYALGKKQITDPLLRDALKRASQEGKVDAQEIFHLYSVGVQGVVSGFTNQAGKIPLIGNKIKGSSEDIRARLSALGTLWGMPFAMVEGFNRRLTFFAAWDVAKATGQADPYAFAVRAVDETQGVYNKVNRPNWARSGPGRVIMTFAQYKIAYVELISRMWKKGGPDGKKAAAFMMAVLILASGINGLPYADDIDDLIDTVGQLFGRNTNMKRNKRKWAYDTLGKFWGDLTLYGVSSKLPLDFSGRLGLGNMLPGTALLKPSDEQGRNRQIAELFGPLAGIGAQVGDAYDAAASGNMGKMGEALAPTAIKNALAGLDMAEKGQATDYKGRKTVDVGLSDAVIKGVGFNPTVIAENTRKNMPVRQDIALLKNVESDIVEMWARGAAENKPELMDKARKKRDDWNDTNPDTPIQVTGRQIMARAKQMATSRDVRTMKAAPRDVRSEVARQLQE
jgi:hypothetical protein